MGSEKNDLPITPVMKEVIPPSPPPVIAPMATDKEIVNFKIFYWFVIFVMSLSLVVMFWMLWLAFVPVKPFEVTRQPFRIMNNNKTVTAGDFLIYEVPYCKYVDSFAEVSRRLEDGFILTMPTVNSHFTVGCRTINDTVMIPFHTPPGKYILSLSMKYHVNMFQDVFLLYKTEEFMIVPNATSSATSK